MAYEPDTMRSLDLPEALYQALFPKGFVALHFAHYDQGERGAFGAGFNFTLRVLVEANKCLNLLLLPVIVLASLMAAVLSLPLALPYWIYRWASGPDQSLSIPLYVRVSAFPGQALIWVVTTPVKVVQVITVVVAITFGPRKLD